MWLKRPSEKPWPWRSSAAVAKPMDAKETAVNCTNQLDSPVKPCTTQSVPITGFGGRGAQVCVKILRPLGLRKEEAEWETEWRA
ncbi:unnamed protein product [Victoria cruziana]